MYHLFDKLVNDEAIIKKTFLLLATTGQIERMKMNNIKIRQKLASHMMKYYQLDKIMGISEATRCRMFRQELPEKEQDRICKLIDDYVKNGGQDHE